VKFGDNIVRELKFTVKAPEGKDKDPIIVAHPDQDKVFTGASHLVSVEVKASGNGQAKANEGTWKAQGFFGKGRSAH
jgi:hypothetical protein